MLVAACMLILGMLRSPDAAWNHGGLRLDAVPDRFPVVLKTGPVALSTVSTGNRRVRVDEVIAGYPALRGRIVLTEQRPGRMEGRGDTLAGIFRKPGGPLNPGSVDRRLQARRKGVAGYVVSHRSERDAGKQAGAAPCKGGRSLERLRAKIETLIENSSRGDCTAVLKAMLLGRRDSLPPEVRGLMVRAGTYHVLAISGLHVGIVVLLLVSAISLLRLPRWPRAGLAVLFVAAYVVFTGARPSALRAGTFFGLLSLGRLLEWRLDYPNAVCATGTVLLLASPHLAWDLGFKLSLGAVFGITLLVPQVHPQRGMRGSAAARTIQYLSLGMAASFCAQLMTLPMVLYHFGRTSLAGVATNLVALPLTTLIVAAGLEASVAALAWRGLALTFMRAAAVLVEALLASMSLAVRIADPLIVTGRPDIYKVAGYYGAVAYLGLARPRMRARYKLPLLLVACALMLVRIPGRVRDDLAATFLYVGDGDACLVETPSGRTLLVDAGPIGRGSDAAGLHIAPFLALKGVSRLDAVVITHPHSDHYGGLATLSAGIEIGEVLVGSRGGEPAYETMLRGLEAGGVLIREMRRGGCVEIGGAVLEFLHPSEEFLKGSMAEGSDVNSGSLVFALTFGETSILFTGDATPEAQQEILRKGGIRRCGVLKVPHHGAPNALDGGFLRAVGADWAVISSGSRFRLHPAPETLEMLVASGARVLTTEWDGAVTVTTDGNEIDVRSRADVLKRGIPLRRTDALSRGGAGPRGRCQKNLPNPAQLTLTP